MKGLNWFKSAITALAVAVLTVTARAQAEESLYRLQVEDVIQIQLYRTSPSQDAISGQVSVDKFGNISAPFAGTLKAAGKTTSELEADLAKEYVKRLRLKEPIVSVTILKFRRILASVTGAVNRPSQFEIRPGDRVLDLLSQSGGYVRDVSDLRHATLLKSGTKERIPIDLYAMLVRADASQNYLIEDGDVLNVPEDTQNRIMVMGMVNRPGTYAYKEPMRISDAIALAGDGIRYRTKFSGLFVLRQKPGLPGQFYRVNVDFVRYVKSGDFTQNIELQPGDFIYVPEVNTPDVNQISSLANVAYILDRFGGSLLGVKIFR